MGAARSARRTRDSGILRSAQLGLAVAGHLGRWVSDLTIALRPPLSEVAGNSSRGGAQLARGPRSIPGAYPSHPPAAQLAHAPLTRVSVGRRRSAEGAASAGRAATGALVRRGELPGSIPAVAAVAAVAYSMVRGVIERLASRDSCDAHSEANLLAELAGLSGGQ